MASVCYTWMSVRRLAGHLRRTAGMRRFALWIGGALALQTAGRGPWHRPLSTSISSSMSSGPMPLTLLTSEVCIGHDATMGHPESPERLAHLLSLARTQWPEQLGASLSVETPDVEASDEQIERIHPPQFVSSLKGAFQRAQAEGTVLTVDGDTRIGPGTGQAVYRAAGLVVHAVDRVVATNDGGGRAFVMARPPGHHAEAATAMGFCFFNSVMVGVAHAEQVYGKQRVAILDFDVHHGNGNQALCQGRATRMYASSHQSPCFPGTGNRAGVSGDASNIVNAPLKPGSGSDEFRQAWTDLILPELRAFNPDMVFISAGFDAHHADPLAQLYLDEKVPSHPRGRHGHAMGAELSGGGWPSRCPSGLLLGHLGDPRRGARRAGGELPRRRLRRGRAWRLRARARGRTHGSGALGRWHGSRLPHDPAGALESWAPGDGTTPAPGCAYAPVDPVSNRSHVCAHASKLA